MVLTILRLVLIAVAIWAAFTSAVRWKAKNRTAGLFLLGAMVFGLVAVAL